MLLSNEGYTTVAVVFIASSHSKAKINGEKDPCMLNLSYSFFIMPAFLLFLAILMVALGQ